jgi:hypothetical protein
MRIRKVAEPFKHLGDEPVKVITVRQTKKLYPEPATVTPILKALEYNQPAKITELD